MLLRRWRKSSTAPTITALTCLPPLAHQTLTDELANIEQTEEHGILQSCAEALGHNKLVRHKDSAVK